MSEFFYTVSDMAQWLTC